ncbi:hypothetical protein INT45_007391 [Circinella minor]|uniref:HAUS augmin-like complex subunit 6 N-terminal domain-containing protein n=1 Tax=Circinella minor TaxID=1195481 RepID=A0A8H7RWX9_9FUNG|nr:hypothetical protein INT45_007391 [Circinella minor]
MNKSIATTNDNTATRFFINLQLLGFVPEKFTHTGVFSKIVFDEHMFSHANNNKAFEATSHFLFHKLDSQRTLLDFAKCWPLTETADYRRQSREYRSIAYRWLDELRIQQCLPGRITLRKSYFEDCRGEKMNTIMFAFSTFVLQKVVDQQRRRHGMIKGKHNYDDNEYPVLRILGTSSVNMLSKEKLIEKLENEISRMSSSITEDEHTLRTSKEHWAKMARKIVSINNNNGFSTIHSPIKEPRHKPNTHQWNGMHSILKTLTNRLDKLNQENKKLRQVATKKEEQLRQMNRSTDSIENVFNPLKTPFPIEKDPIINDLPPLVLPIQSINERKKRIQDYVDKLVIELRNNSKKRQYEPEVTNDNQQQNNDTTSKRQKIVSSSPSLPSSPWLLKVEHEQHQISTMPIKSVAPETGGMITTLASSSASRIPRPSRYSITSTDVNSPVRQDRTSPVVNRQRRSATPHNHTIGSPFSYISEKVSPLSTTYPDYCENIVNQMVVDFHAQQTPERSKILSPIDNNNHTERLSISSPLKNWPTPTMTTPTKSLAKRLSTFSRDENSKLSSPQNQKLIAMKGRKTSIVVGEEEEEEEETTVPSYYEEDQLDYVYQHSPSRRSPPLSRRPSRSSMGLENRSSGFMNSTFASPAASSLDAYRTAMDEQDKNGTLGLLGITHS